MRTSRSFCVPIAALVMAFVTAGCTDSPDPVSVPRQASPPNRPSMIGIPTSNAIEYVDGEGKLDLTDVQFEFPEGFVAAAPIVVTGKYEIKSIPACGGCKVTAYIGLEYDADQLPTGATANWVIAETDGSNLPATGTFRWTSRLRKTRGYTLIGAGQIKSSDFSPTTTGHQGFDLNGYSPTPFEGWALMWEDVILPGIFPTLTGTVNAAGWYSSDVNLSWEVIYPDIVDNSKTGCDPVVVNTDTNGRTIECSAKSFVFDTSRSVTIKRDATPPTVINVGVSPPPNANGWRNTDVTVSWQCTDETSGPLVLAGMEMLGEDINAMQATCADNAGNVARTTVGGILVDKGAPTLSPSVSPNPIVQNGSATATPNASDARSGIASASCDAVVTTQVGTFSVNCQATDKAGNTATQSVSYVVKSPYTFSGFLTPIVPGTLNSRTAGAAVPVQFKVGGNKGLNILASGSPSSKPLTCPAGVTVTTVTETTTSSNGGGLQYDAASDTYTYVWKTEKAWAGTCRTLVLKLTDGIEHAADFQFKK